ncbi:hypothetical protein [Natronobacterium gregoryi]|uniref:DUF8052 domain-containing protein n=2 Tax=Natronobacterium gregoryi TaxID=44930 RepID=L0ANC8_NATGS|nr:hypothetical protein [Natronobacterium gregoryi]AFZ74692.1 hypothetical protein Natgr_3578 [Natronobacterium gregoryi SP2]ELY73403.1 hypothetical protein C490_01520 [Natronobacterium gregoryi SP2]PLK20937.1 hypothetical protein CYV19_06655 [Natronobacterium gregoryi SP2]SFJ04721.1 hypothetical protein SAMN05443661_11266 [Natronobacterium gregoryi]
MSDSERPTEEPPEAESDQTGDAPLEPVDEALTAVPDWDDGYLDRVGDRLFHNYDLEKGYVVDGDQFALYGELELRSQKHFLHPAISFAEHESAEHLFATRVDRVDDRTLDRYVELGHQLADEWIEPDEQHFCTEFTFVAIAPSIPVDVRDRVDRFDGRNLLKYGFHGHYEINLVVAAPGDEELVACDNADVATAFRVWDPIETEEPGLLDLIARRLQL